MTEFTFLFRGREASASPAQMQKTMDKWVTWMKSLRSEGVLKDPGNPLADSGKVVSGNNKLVINDGPYAEAKDVVNGYMVIEATDMEDATRIAQGCPILEAGGCV